MHGINEELSMEYAMARRLLPGATVDQIAERITGRLTAEQHLVLAQDTLLWHEEPADRRELALIAVRNFVLAIESDSEGDGPEEADEPLR